MATAVLAFIVNEEMKKEKDKKRRLKKKRFGFSPKRRKLAKPAELAVQLESEESWLRYLRYMFISAYKMVLSEYTDCDEALGVIEAWCPVKIGEEGPVIVKEGREILEDYELGALCEMLTSYINNAPMEPGVVIKASEMLEKLRRYFPVSKDALKKTPYEECESSVVSKEEITRLADSFKKAAQHRHVGADVVPITMSI